MPILLTIAILFISTLTRSTLGFGDALLAMPLLTLIIGIKTTTPLVALGASTIATTILLKSWRQVDVKAVWRLVLSSFLGLPLGLLLLKTAPESLVKAILGIVLILFGLYSLIMPKLPPVEGKKLSYLTGFIAGILGGAYNINGPPIVVYGALTRWPPERFRATLQGYFLPTGLSILIGHGLAGLWTPTVLKLYAYAFPIIVLAIFLGGKLNSLIPHGHFDRYIYAALIVMGLLLLF